VSWIYLDDRFPEHPKVMMATALHPMAPWLFVCGLAYCRRNHSGGLIPALAVSLLLPKYRKTMADALVTVNLWERVGGDGAVSVHDYAEWNRSEAEEMGRAKTRHERAKKGAAARWAQK